MVVGVLTGRGPLPLLKVPSNVKISAQVYIDSVLKPILEVHLPKLYPGEMEKVYIHHEKSTSHTAKKVVNYASAIHHQLGITIISNKDIPVKSRDISQLDFFGFGYLKQQLYFRHARTLDGLWKVAQEEWIGISFETIFKVFSNWKTRCRAVNKNQGYQIENTNHSKKIFLQK